MKTLKEFLSESSMHGNIGAPGNRDFKRREMEYELRHETNHPAKKLYKTSQKMTGLIYHDAGTNTDRKGRKYTPHYGTKQEGHTLANSTGARYVHLGD